MNTRTKIFWGGLVLLLALGLVGIGKALAAVSTDQSDYAPGSVVTVSGDNSDDAGYLAGETVHVDVSGPNGYVAACDAIADDAGAWSCQVTLAGDDTAVGDYAYTATGQDSGVSQSGMFTDDKPPKPTSTPEPTPTPVVVNWTGNGTTDGYCNDFKDDPDLDPGPGQQGWLFILTSSFDDSGSLLTTSFSPNFQNPINPIAGVLKGGGSYHYIVYTELGAKLLSASATNGTDKSNLVVSHCEKGLQAQDLTISKTANPSYTRTFKWAIEKSADYNLIKTAGSATFYYTVEVTKDSGTDSDWAVAGTITVHNPNSFAVNGVDVTDATPDGDCTVTGSPLNVPAGSNAYADYVCIFTSNPGSGTNTATATWSDIGSPNTSASGTADYAFGDPTKLVNNEIDVTDTNGGSWHFTDSGSVTYETIYNDPAGTCTKHENTATIVGTDLSASKTVIVCVGADLQVSKDAASSFKRTYTWDISKDVTPKLVEQFGGTATFYYTVNAWQSGFADSEWVVSGNIHVYNPNDWEAITFDASDSVPGGDCSVTDGTGVVLAAGADIYLPYACTFTVQPAYNSDLTNNATATWDSAAYYTPHGSASGNAVFQFTTPTTLVNKTVTITDMFNDGDPETLGTITATDEEPWASATFNYTREIPVPTWNCLFYINTAKIVETGQSASQKVEVCGPAKTGALTMGFWQNKNGQGIIGIYSGMDCQALRTWLNGFAPFADLTATNCTGVKSYITNVIKAANASGSSMNAMLKAQMLATALDVYFSDPTLGGNQINTPAPIGGVTIDLTKINKPIGSSTFEDVSSAFGGATSMKIIDMLAYAAGQSDVGGSMWYGNVKAVQELAKDAFDAINNQKVFAP